MAPLAMQIYERKMSESRNSTGRSWPAEKMVGPQIPLAACLEYGLAHRPIREINAVGHRSYVRPCRTLLNMGNFAVIYYPNKPKR